jgi:hypothetical protein
MERWCCRIKGGCENENGKEKENLSLDCELGYKNSVLHKEKFCEWNKKKNKVLKEEGDGIGVNGQRLVWIVQRTSN